MVIEQYLLGIFYSQKMSKDGNMESKKWFNVC